MQARTLLSLWCRIDRHIERNERLVSLTAQHSFASDVSAESIVEKILERIYQKERLQIIKNKIEKLVDMLHARQQQVIRFYFWDKVNAAEIASITNVNIRTVFRQLKSGIDEIACNLDHVVFNTFAFNNLLENKWVRNVYDAIQGGEHLEVV